MLFIHSAFLLYSFYSHILLQKYSFCIRLFFYLHAFSNDSWVEFSFVIFVILEGPVFLVLFNFVQVLFEFPFFR